MIPKEDYIAQRKLYTKHGKGLWRIIGYCSEPSLVMQNVITKERENFGIGGETAKSFESIEGLQAGRGLEPVEVEGL